MSISSQLKTREWRRDGYLVSTDISLIPISELIEMFALKEFYWANPLPEDAMKQTLENSLNFSLFETTDDGLKFIGYSRCVTDMTTFLYLTDVWVNLDKQGLGLGTWVIKCVQEVIEEMPHLRRSMLFTSDWKRSVPFYERHMEMEVLESVHGTATATMQRKGRGHPNFGKKGHGYGHLT